MTQDELRNLIEKMADAREAMNVQRDLLSDLRREARSEGLNLQAINPLVDIMGEHRHDRGSKVLNDLIEYAQTAGVELDLIQATAAVQAAPAAAPAEAVAAPGQEPISREPAMNGIWSSTWVRGTWHIGLVCAISATLLWLLN